MPYPPHKPFHCALTLELQTAKWEVSAHLSLLLRPIGGHPDVSAHSKVPPSPYAVSGRGKVHDALETKGGGISLHPAPQCPKSPHENARLYKRETHIHRGMQDVVGASGPVGGR